MMNTIEMFSGLANVKIEGIEVTAVKYKNIVEQAKKKNYDILDHRKAEVQISDRIRGGDVNCLDFRAKLQGMSQGRYVTNWAMHP